MPRAKPKPEPETKRPVGRPKADVNPVAVEAAASVGCTMKEIATIAGCSVATLENHFSDVIERGRNNLNMSLRRKQVEIAKAGNVSMLIWLGKNLLGQSERTTVDIDVSKLTDSELESILERAGSRRTGTKA